MKILALLAKANGYGKDEAGRLYLAVQNAEREGLDNYVDCRNYLLVANFTQELPEYFRSAVLALNERLASNEYTEYANRLQWCREICNGNDNVAKGIFNYVAGRYDTALKCFEREMNSGSEFPVKEMAAAVAFVGGNMEKAYEHAAGAQWIDDETRIDIPWLTEIEEKARKVIGASAADCLTAKVRACKQTANRIGFLA